jgi:hypothetical protein
VLIKERFVITLELGNVGFIGIDGLLLICNFVSRSGRFILFRGNLPSQRLRLLPAEWPLRDRIIDSTFFFRRIAGRSIARRPQFELRNDIAVKIGIGHAFYVIAGRLLPASKIAQLAYSRIDAVLGLLRALVGSVGTIIGLLYYLVACCLRFRAGFLNVARLRLLIILLLSFTAKVLGIRPCSKHRARKQG